MTPLILHSWKIKIPSGRTLKVEEIEGGESVGLRIEDKTEMMNGQIQLSREEFRALGELFYRVKWKETGA